MIFSEKWDDAIGQRDWPKIEQMIKKNTKAGFMLHVLRQCCDCEAPLSIIRMALQDTPGNIVENGMLKNSIHRKDIVQILLSHNPSLIYSEHHWLAYTAINQGHLQTADYLLTEFYSNMKRNRQYEMRFIVTRNDDKVIQNWSIETIELLLHHFPHMFTRWYQRPVVTAFLLQGKIDRVLQLMFDGTFWPNAIYDALSWLFMARKIQMCKGNYWHIVHLIFEHVTSEPRYVFSIAEHKPIFDFCKFQDYMHVKPLLRMWEKYWVAATPYNYYSRPKSALLFACGYFMYKKQKRKVQRAKYEMCQRKAIQLALGLQQLELPVLLQTNLYYSVCEPVSNSVDLHIVDLVLVQVKKALLGKSTTLTN